MFRYAKLPSSVEQGNAKVKHYVEPTPTLCPCFQDQFSQSREYRGREWSVSRRVHPNVARLSPWWFPSQGLTETEFGSPDAINGPTG